MDKNKKVTVVNAEVGDVMAWKNGMFIFNGTPIEDIMRQVSRWYDVDVVFEGKVPELAVASIPKAVPVSKLLHLLELTDRVHFKVEGRKITVMPKG